MIKMFYSYLDLLKVYDFYVKLELSCCRIYCVNLPSSIDRNSCRLFFYRIFQLNSSLFDMQGFMFCLKYKRKYLSHVLGGSLCCVCESFVGSRDGSLHTYLGFQVSRLCQELGHRFSCCIKSLKIHKQGCLYLLGIQKRSSPWTQSYHVVVVVSFYLRQQQDVSGLSRYCVNFNSFIVDSVLP